MADPPSWVISPPDTEAVLVSPEIGMVVKVGICPEIKVESGL